MAQVVECLLSKTEALSSNSNIVKQTNKKPPPLPIKPTNNLKQQIAQ
jgi:hypothetical protein